MTKILKAVEYVRIGELIQFLKTPSGQNNQVYRDHINKFLDHLQACDLTATLSTAEILRSLQFYFNAIDGRILENNCGPLLLISQTIEKSLYYEAGNRSTLVLNTGDVSEKLRRLPVLLPVGKNLTDEQTALFNETIRCIECSAYRAAAVMGWNLAYDYIRQWVFDNKRIELNAVLARKFQRKAKPPQIIQYRDFFALTERVVIEAMADASAGPPIIGEEVRDHLFQYLRYRNKYAHPSTEKSATAEKTNSYIQHLIDIIIDKPFA